MSASEPTAIQARNSKRNGVDPHVDTLRLTVTRLARQLRKHSGTELTPTQISALDVLGRHGRIRIGRLAQIEGISKPTATRLTGKLEDLGLVDRSQDHTDGRGCQVGLTRKGEDHLAEASRSADRYLADQLSVLPLNDQRRLLDALPAFLRLLEHKA